MEGINKAIELTPQYLESYRNTGGFDVIGEYHPANVGYQPASRRSRAVNRIKVHS